ncbi:MAG: hypothetical protein QG602_913 [Verrucomicrobiota bacterium]|nr:hypothetical protein [Verrucomicrobiota bacterium]
MTPSPEENRGSSQKPRPDREAVCRQCGRPEAQAVGDEVLCPACLHARGSCGAVRDDEE